VTPGGDRRSGGSGGPHSDEPRGDESRGRDDDRGDTGDRVIRIPVSGNGDGRRPPDLDPGGKPPRIGSGQLQWNTWGWFGGQVGSSIWLLVLGIIAVVQGDALGWVPIGLCLLANLVGTLLWWWRDRLAPFPAVEILLGTITLLSAGGVVTILEAGLLGVGPDVPPGRWVYLYLLIFPALMVQLWVVDHARREPEDDEDEEDDDLWGR